MSAGNQNKKLKIAFLLACALILSVQVVGQVKAFSFNYTESVLSDYSNLMGAGKGGKAKSDSLEHRGNLFLIYVNDTMVNIGIQTELFKSSVSGTKFKTDLVGSLILDKNERISKILSSSEDASFFMLSTTWLEEINFKTPGMGVVVERKKDGEFLVNYVFDGRGKQIILEKKGPQIKLPLQSTQAVVFDNYVSSTSYISENNHLAYVKVNEIKRQFIGRKALACINRKLAIEPLNKAERFLSPNISFSDLVTIEPFRRLSEEQRRVQIGTSLLGGVTLSDLVDESQQPDSLNNEDRFRLKSKWRSLLIVDSTVFPFIVSFYEAAPNPSVLIQILEDAIIESKLPASYIFINQKIRSSKSDYAKLKSLLIKLSLANSFNSETLEELVQVLEETDDKNIQSLVSLTLSNFALDLRVSNPLQYERITNRLLSLYKSGGTDTLQYIYIVGNAGIVSEERKLVSLLTSSFEEEAILALRHIHSSFADSVITSYILNKKSLGPSFYISLLTNRELSIQFVEDLSQQIIDSDKVGNERLLPALQFLLDFRYRKFLDLSLIEKHKFKSNLYLSELEESRNSASLCGSGQ